MLVQVLRELVQQVSLSNTLSIKYSCKKWVQVLRELLQQGPDEDFEDQRGQGSHSSAVWCWCSHCKLAIFIILLSCLYLHWSYLSDFSQMSEFILLKISFSDLRRDIGQVCGRVRPSLQPGLVACFKPACLIIRLVLQFVWQIVSILSTVFLYPLITQEMDKLWILSVISHSLLERSNKLRKNFLRRWESWASWTKRWSTLRAGCRYATLVINKHCLSCWFFFSFLFLLQVCKITAYHAGHADDGEGGHDNNKQEGHTGDHPNGNVTSIKSNQIKSNQIKSNQIKSNQIILM